jgi:hypothetical protein
MAKQLGTLQLLGTLLVSALKPFQVALSDPAQFKRFMFRLGWNVSGMPPAYVNLGSLIDAAVQKQAGLGNAPSGLDVLDFLAKTAAAFNGIRSISVAPPGVDAAAFLAEAREQIVARLLTDHLAAELPAIYNVLSALNAIQFETAPASASRPALLRIKLDWQAIPGFLRDPMSVFPAAFGWGTPDFQSAKVVDRLAEFFTAMKFPVSIELSADEVVRGYAPSARDPLPTSKTLERFPSTLNRRDSQPL